MYLLTGFALSVPFFHTASAETPDASSSQITLSDNLSNDPLAQDILKKIEQTKKLIAELEQKEFENNKAQEHLDKMRQISIERLEQNLDEWQRLWERHSSKNSFESFVNKKPSYVQGVFWDQFEFKEQKVNAGRIAMGQVLANGGTMQDAKNAYFKAAASKKIELIEMNAQFNVNHNLADYQEQQIFNSSGQAHMSPSNYAKLKEMYSDYKLQPSYILANSEKKVMPEVKSNENECNEGTVLVTRLTSGHQSCVEESIAKKWIENGIQGLEFSGQSIRNTNMATNPGSQCDDGFVVVFHFEKSEYQCVLEEDAKRMVDQNIAEIHSLTEYIESKDKLKEYEDIIYEINQEVRLITEEYDLKRQLIKTDIGKQMENEKHVHKQMVSDAVNNYRAGDLTKEEISEKILEIENNGENIKDQLLDKLQGELSLIESEYKEGIREAVSGYEGNQDVNVDWDYFDEIQDVKSVVIENDVEEDDPVKVSISGDNVHTIKENVLLNDIAIVNSFGQSFDEIKTEQILQISADISNLQKHENDFAYVVEITDAENNITQPARWITGTLNPEQNFNVSLSWVPEETGLYNATISIGSSLDSVLQVADVEINVNPEGDPSDENYCKNGHELLFKYSDNSPICVSDETASKLINIGLAFA